MPRSKSLYAPDPASLKILEAALASSDGLELVFPSKAMAETRRFSLYHARKCDRKLNPPNYISKYDQIQVLLRQKGEDWILAVVHGYLNPDIVIRDIATGDIINLASLPAIRIEPSVMAKLSGPEDLGLSTAPPPAITQEEAIQTSLRSAASQTDAAIQKLAATGDPSILESLLADRRDARIQLGWCPDCGAQEGQTHTASCSAGADGRH